jgi:hypothetical protein
MVSMRHGVRCLSVGRKDLFFGIHPPIRLHGKDFFDQTTFLLGFGNLKIVQTLPTCS